MERRQQPHAPAIGVLYSGSWSPLVLRTLRSSREKYPCPATGYNGNYVWKYYYLCARYLFFFLPLP